MKLVCSGLSARILIKKLKNTKSFWSITKGQTKSQQFFQADVPSKNRTNEFNFTSMIPQVDLFLFVFWKKLKTPKRHFEINWPLVWLKIPQMRQNLSAQKAQKIWISMKKGFIGTSVVRDLSYTLYWTNFRVPGLFRKFIF